VPPTLVLPCRGEVHGLVTASTCRQDDAAVTRGLSHSRASHGCPPSAYGFSCSRSASWGWCCRSSTAARTSRLASSTVSRTLSPDHQLCLPTHQLE
jgi:hypothetical protein